MITGEAASLEASSILIVDDEPANVTLLERMLRHAGYSNLTGTTDSRQVPRLFAENRPDLVLLDLHMPHVDGFETMDLLSALIAEGAYLPILVITADTTQVARQRAFSNGARDFVTKPFDVTEVLLRVRSLLQTRDLHERLAVRAKESSSEAQDAQLETLQRLAIAAEYRDDETGEHIVRVGRMAGYLARVYGLPKAQSDMIGVAAPLHDVGKIGIADSILLKTEALTDEEFERVRVHTIVGAAILSDSRFPLVQMASEIAITHHERWDGSGYPRGLKGTAIPVEGRIVAVADVYDALTHERRYKDAWSVEHALDEIASHSGRGFDPDVVTSFLQVAAS